MTGGVPLCPARYPPQSVAACPSRAAQHILSPWDQITRDDLWRIDAASCWFRSIPTVYMRGGGSASAVRERADDGESTRELGMGVALGKVE